MAYNRPFLDLLATAGISIKSSKLGPEAQPERPATFDGQPITLWVVAAAGGRNRPHRVMARCWCGRVCAAGKLAQHVRAHREAR